MCTEFSLLKIATQYINCSFRNVLLRRKRKTNEAKTTLTRRLNKLTLFIQLSDVVAEFLKMKQLLSFCSPDGLTDCGDSSCCSHPACSENIMCVYFADPLEVLQSRLAANGGPDTADTGATFFEQVRFLIEGDKPVQSYAKPEFYDGRRAAVIRGRVTTPTGEGIIGVRVSVDRTRGASNYGFTLTRPGGWFDMLVNGGGGVTLQFQRSPFRPLTRTLSVPWNRIQVIEPIVMASAGSSSSGGGIVWEEEEESSAAAVAVRFSAPCLTHHNQLPSPSILEYSVLWSQDGGGGGDDGRTILVGGILREVIPVPDTPLHLTYLSSTADRQLSTFAVRLTGGAAAAGLTGLARVHVRVEVAGQLISKVLEPEPDLVYTYGWNKVGSNM